MLRNPARIPGDALRRQDETLQRIGADIERRALDPLRIYQPMGDQSPFHQSRSRIRIFQKGNRAGGPLPLSTPVLTPRGWVPIGQLNIGDEVIGGDGKACRVVDTRRQGWLPTFRLTFDDGASIVCSEDHHWTCKLKKSERFGPGRLTKWGVYSLSQIRMHGGDKPIPRDRAVIPCVVSDMEEREVPLDPYTLGVLLGDGGLSQSGVQFTTEDAEIAEMVQEGLGDFGKVTTRKPIPDSRAACYGVTATFGTTTGKPSPVKQALVELGLMGLLSHQKFIPDCYLENSVEIRLNLLRGLMDTDGTADKRGRAYFYTNSPRLAEGVVRLARSLGAKSKIRWRETSIATVREKRKGRPKAMWGRVPRRKCLNMAVVTIDLPYFSPFGLKRKTERWEARERAAIHGRFLEKIEPCGNADCCCITVDSPNSTFVAQDYIVTHNSTAGAIEVARAAKGRDPWGKYPKPPLRIWIVVYREDNIGRTVHRMLFEPGLFDIIRDPVTKEWRAFVPDAAWDKKHASEKRLSPPLIEEDEVEGWSWKDVKARIFSVCRLKNGTQIHAFCSATEPPMGDPIHLAWIDEDLRLKKVWMQELIARTMDYEGVILWTANPKGQNDALQKWVAEAEEDKQSEAPSIEVFRLNSMDNKYIPKKSRDSSYQLWLREGEEVARARNTGDFVLDSLLMYPEFSMERHGVPNVLDPECLNRDAYDHNIDWFLRTCEIPADWTRFLWIDPGIQVTAAEFFAVPPPEVGDFVVAYKEVFLMGKPLSVFAAAIRDALAGDTLYSMGADNHYSRVRDWSQGKTRVEQMSDAFRELGIRSESTGFGFRPGSDDKEGRQSMLHSWLAVRTTPDGSILRPKFCVLRAKHNRLRPACPHLVRQFGLTMKVFQHDEAKDKRIDRDCDTIDCVEYAAHDTSLRFHRTSRIGKGRDRMGELMTFLNPTPQGDGHLHLAPGPPRPVVPTW